MIPNKPLMRASLWRKKPWLIAAGLGLASAAGVLVMDALHWGGLWMDAAQGRPSQVAHAASPAPAPGAETATALVARAEPAASSPVVPRRAIAPALAAASAAQPDAAEAAPTSMAEPAVAAQPPAATEPLADAGLRCPAGLAFETPQNMPPPVAMMLAACASVDYWLHSLNQQIRPL